MATEKQANKAREKHGDKLMDIGAHSLGVDEIGKKGSKNFAVIAYLDKEVKDFPEELILSSGTKKIKVPLVVHIAKKFKLE